MGRSGKKTALKGYWRFSMLEGQDSSQGWRRKPATNWRTKKTLEKVLPDVRNHIVQKELGTPITNEYYINSTRGSVYGTEKKLTQIGPFSYRAKSEIKNLYLCGASIVSHGVAGAGYSGLQTAGEILGKKQAELLKNGKDETINIFEAEDDSCYPVWLKNKISAKKRRIVAK